MVQLKKRPKKDPAVKRVAWSGRFSPEIRMFLQNQGNGSETVESLIRQSKEYAEWLRRRRG